MILIIRFSCLDHTFPVHFVYLLYMQLPVQCGKQEFSSPLAFKKVQFRQKKLCVLKILFSYRKVSIRKQFFTGVDIKKSRLRLDIFYVSPCKKPFSDLYLSIFEHNLENKQLILKFRMYSLCDFQRQKSPYGQSLKYSKFAILLE